MNNKIHIEEIELLLPDYITGLLNEEDKQKVEDALASSSSLKALYTEMKDALDFADSVQAQEPSPQYWNNLLPRIHQKIEEKERRKSFSYAWKILLPAAAVILIFIIFRISFTPKIEITEKQINKTDNQKVETKDTAEKKINKIQTPVQEKKNIANENTIEKPHYLKRSIKNKIEVNTADNYIKVDTEKKENLKKVFPENDDYASVAEVEDYSIFGAGVPGAIDDETAEELDKLSGNEQNDLLETLSKSNL